MCKALSYATHCRHSIRDKNYVPVTYSIKDMNNQFNYNLNFFLNIGPAAAGPAGPVPTPM